MKGEQASIVAVMRRPRWIAMLLLALAVAAVFAGLGQWQLERAVTSQGGDPATETLRPLEQVAQPQSPVLSSQAGQRVRVRGAYASSDFSIIADRLHDGRSGYWVVGRFVVDVPSSPQTSVAVAVGWAPDADSAKTAASQAPLALSGTKEITGRYAGTEAPEAPSSGNATASVPTRMSVAALLNVWNDVPADADVYGGYVIADAAPSPLTVIEAGPPEQVVELNWLNIFYAIEWVVFAGFAVFLWYRLVRDAWERERDARLESEHGSGTETG